MKKGRSYGNSPGTTGILRGWRRKGIPLFSSPPPPRGRWSLNPGTLARLQGGCKLSPQPVLAPNEGSKHTQQDITMCTWTPRPEPLWSGRPVSAHPRHLLSSSQPARVTRQSTHSPLLHEATFSRLEETAISPNSFECTVKVKRK